jgi:pimeloyl-ACP methyl ester carboxylesterase
VASFSRPGYGLSTRQPGRRVIEAVADTRAVLDAVGAERCLVAGWSGGGPHALACAARLEPVDAALTIAAVAPYGVAGLDWMAGMGEENLVEFGATLQGESVLRTYLDGVRPHLQTVTVDEIISSLDSLLPAVDKAVLTDEFGQDMAASFHRALEGGVDGWLDDDLAFTSPWGFDVSAIAVPVTIWQGSADLMVPFAHGQWLAAQVPGASVHLEEGEGHLSIGIGAIDRMLDELVASAGWR